MNYANHSSPGLVGYLRYPPFRCCVLLMVIAGGFGIATIQHQYATIGFWQSLWQPDFTNIQEAVFFYTWLPRIAMAILCGAGLSLAGILMQQVLQNPLASPTTLGIASGAQLSLMLATLWMPEMLSASKASVAMAGGLLAVGLVFSLTWKRGLSPVLLILAGLVVNLFFASVSSTLLLFYQDELKGLSIWSAGSLAQTSWEGVVYLWPRLVFSFVCIVLMIRPLGLLELNEVSAKSLGVSLRHLRFISLGLAIFITGCVVSVAGLIGFIGLAAPALVKALGARTFRSRLGWSVLFGACLLLATDLLLQWLTTRFTLFLPTGAMTSLLGAPLLLWLIPRLRQQRHTPIASQSVTIKRRHASPNRLLSLFLACLALSLVVSLFVGKGQSGWTFWNTDLLYAVMEWRLPRVLAAMAAGMLLALAGTIIQRLTANPMASPELLGVSGGCAMGVLLALMLIPDLSLSGLLITGVLSALLMLFVLLLLNQRSEFRQERILLTGMALTALLDPIRTIVLAESDPSTQQMLAWISGSTYFVTGSIAYPAIVFAFIAWLGCRFFLRWLDILPFGAVTASSVGIHVPQARICLLLFVAVLAAVATLLVGPLSFVGLLAPHMARLFGLTRAQDHLNGAIVLGAILMVGADWVGRQWLFPNEIPAGLVASLIGGFYFMWGLRQS